MPSGVSAAACFHCLSYSCCLLRVCLLRCVSAFALYLPSWCFAAALLSWLSASRCPVLAAVCLRDVRHTSASNFFHKVILLTLTFPSNNPDNQKNQVETKTTLKSRQPPDNQENSRQPLKSLDNPDTNRTLYNLENSLHIPSQTPTHLTLNASICIPSLLMHEKAAPRT